MIAPNVLTSSTSLVLTNAIYFLGTWNDPFEPSDTRPDTPFFNTEAGDPAKVSMMENIARYPHADFDTYQALEIPYAGRNLGMVVFLPKAKTGLQALEAQLTNPETLKKAIDALKPEKVDLEFPKFKLTQSIGLKKELSALGMPLAFDARKGDFSGMSTEEKLYISEVIHKAFVEVDEKGTEAAAATAVVMMKRSAITVAPAPPIPFKADHPFLFLIRERTTGSVLFLGRFVEPAE